MTDRITITIEKDIDENGVGTVVDKSIADLGTGPNDTPILDLLTAAFADAYGVHSVPDPTDAEAEPIPVSVYRNVSYQLRKHCTTIALNYAGKQIDAVAKAQKQATASAALAAMTVVEDK